MRNLILILAVLVGTGLSAQNRNVTGPEAKNFKPWQNKDKTTLVISKVEKSSLKGPEAKNFKPWKDDAERVEYVVVSNNKRKNLRGPAAKNFKPWQNRKENVIVRTTKIETDHVVVID